MRALIFLLLALAAPATVQPSAETPRQFSDVELETIFAHVLTLPPTRG